MPVMAAEYFDKVTYYVFEAPPQFKRMMQMDFRSKQWPEFLEKHEKLLVKNGNNGHYVGEVVGL
jgi:hypothetical protein